jgi:hypothetical protein
MIIGYSEFSEEADALHQQNLNSIIKNINEFVKSRNIKLELNSHGWPSRLMTWISNGIHRTIQIYVASDKQTYMFWVAASKDIDNKRYWKQTTLKDNVSWDEIFSDIDKLLAEGYELANSWKNEDLSYASDIGGQTDS